MLNNAKLCKIIEEVSMFILERGYSNLNIDIKKEEKQSVLTFIWDKCDEEMKEFILDKITNGRNYEIEQYGWELMGEGASEDDLGIVNALIDSMDYLEEGNKSILRMVRNDS